MAYIGFDLDETLGDFHLLNVYTYFLQPQQSLYEGQWSGRYGSVKVEPPPLSSTLQKKLQNATHHFLDCIVAKQPNLCNPEMIELFQQIPRETNVLIYSNNGNLALLHLAAKMISKLADLPPDFFQAFIHWYHPLRKNEVNIGDPGAGSKTTAVLQKAFPDHPPIPLLFFFDDLLHPDLHRTLGERYFKVIPYKNKADTTELTKCFRKALSSEDLDTDPEYFEYIAPLLQGKSDFGSILKFIEKEQKRVEQNGYPRPVQRGAKRKTRRRSS